jgi:hypothetical protein
MSYDVTIPAFEDRKSIQDRLIALRDRLTDEADKVTLTDAANWMSKYGPAFAPASIKRTVETAAFNEGPE